MEKGQGAAMPSKQALFHKYPRIDNSEALQTPSVWVFMEAHSIGLID